MWFSWCKKFKITCTILYLSFSMVKKKIRFELCQPLSFYWMERLFIKCSPTTITFLKAWTSFYAKKLFKLYMGCTWPMLIKLDILLLFIFNLKKTGYDSKRVLRGSFRKTWNKINSTEKNTYDWMAVNINRKWNRYTYLLVTMRNIIKYYV